MNTRRYALILACLAVALLGLGGAGVRAGGLATPAIDAPALIETTLVIQPRDDAFPLLTSSLTIRIPADWPEADMLLATPIDSASWSSALEAILVRLQIAPDSMAADGMEGEAGGEDAAGEVELAARDLFPTAPDIMVEDGLLTLSSRRTAELRGESGADLGLWRVGLGPCAVVERTSPDPVLPAGDSGVAGGDAGTFDVESYMEDETGPTIQVRFDQPCDLHVVLELPGETSGSAGMPPDSGPGVATPQLIADVRYEDSELVAAAPMPVSLSNGHVRWRFAGDPATWMVEAQVRPPQSTRLRFKTVAGLSNLQPLGMYLGPAVVLLSAFVVGRRLPATAPDDPALARDGVRLRRVTAASLVYLATGICSWYALLWLQDVMEERGEDWKAGLYFGVAALPYLAAGALAATVGWDAVGRLRRPWALAVVSTLVIAVVVLMAPLSIDVATAEPDARTYVDDHEVVQWLPILIPLLTTGFVACALLWPAVGMDSPPAVGERAAEKRTDRRDVSPHIAARPVRTAADRLDRRRQRRFALAVVVAVLSIVGAWLLFEWLEAAGLGDAAWGARLQSILTFGGFFYAFEFVSEAAAFMPLIALGLLWAAIRRTGTARLAPRPVPTQEWVWAGFGVLFAAFVVGYGVAILGIQLPIGYLVALVLWRAGRAALTRWAASNRTPASGAGQAPGILSPSSPYPGVAPERQASWWELGVLATRWGFVLGIPMVALFVYVLLADEGTRWFELSPSFRLMKLIIVVANEYAVWVVGAFVLGCLYTSMPGRYGWAKGLALALVFTVSEAAGLVARMLTGENPGVEWLFRPSQVALFLMAIGMILDVRLRYRGWDGVRALLARSFWMDPGRLQRLTGVVGYVSPLALSTFAVIQQVLSGNATAALTELISVLPDLVSPLGRSA